MIITIFICGVAESSFNALLKIHLHFYFRKYTNKVNKYNTLSKYVFML